MTTGATWTRRHNKLNHPRNGERWSKGEVDYLINTWMGEVTDKMVEELQRTRSGIYNKASSIGLVEQTKEKAEVIRVTVEPAMEKITTEEKEAGLDLVIWFCQEAYLEGHAVEIPALGARFKKEKAWPTYR